MRRPRRWRARQQLPGARGPGGRTRDRSPWRAWRPTAALGPLQQAVPGASAGPSAGCARRACSWRPTRCSRRAGPPETRRSARRSPATCAAARAIPRSSRRSRRSRATRRLRPRCPPSPPWPSVGLRPSSPQDRRRQAPSSCDRPRSGTRWSAWQLAQSSSPWPAARTSWWRSPTAGRACGRCWTSAGSTSSATSRSVTTSSSSAPSSPGRSSAARRSCTPRCPSWPTSPRSSGRSRSGTGAPSVATASRRRRQATSCRSCS